MIITQQCTCGCQVCLSNTGLLREGVRLAEKEIEQLQFMLNFRDIGLEKRDVMLNKYMEQMTRLHEEIKELKISNKKLSQKIQTIDILKEDKQLLLKSEIPADSKQGKNNSSNKQSQDPFFNFNKSPSRTYSVGMGSLNMDQISDKQQSMIFKMQASMIFGDLVKQVDSARLSSTPKNMTSRSSSLHKNSSTDKRKVTTFPHQISVVTVTDKQGRHDDDTVFRNELEANSLMERGEEDLFTNKKLLSLEKLFQNYSRFQSYFSEMSESQQKYLVKLVNQAFSDLKRFFSLSIRYKELLSVTSEIGKYSSFENAFDIILKKICSHLKCDTASIFLADYRNKELWTIANKTSSKTIRFPLNPNSVAGYCIIHQITMNVFDAYEDVRFNKQIDLDTGYRTKTILCVPIKDENNKIVGCLEAINKIKEVFNQQDQEMLELLGNFCSSILKNSLKMDQIVLQKEYYKKLIGVGNAVSYASSMKETILECQEKLKELISSDKCKVFLYSQESNSFLVYSKDKKDPDTIHITSKGIAICVFQSQKLIVIQNPREEGNYDEDVDINTSLPLIVVPIFNKDYSRVIAIYEAENGKGFFFKNFGEEELQNSPDSLKVYAEMIGNAISNQISFDEKIKSIQNPDSSQNSNNNI